MRFVTASISIFATLAATVSAQAMASDADVTQIGTQITNVTDSVRELDKQINAFQSAADAATLLNASTSVIGALTHGISLIKPIQGQIGILQATDILISKVTELNVVVAGAVTDIENKKPTLVKASVGSIVYDQVSQQLTAAQNFRDTIDAKFSQDDQNVVTVVSQPSIDSLKEALAYYSDQKSGGSSAAASSTKSGSAARRTGSVLDAGLAVAGLVAVMAV